MPTMPMNRGRRLALTLLPMMLMACTAQPVVQPGVQPAAQPAAAAPPAQPVAKSAAAPVASPKPAVAANAPEKSQVKVELPPPSAAETQFGIQIAHVGVAAAGGLVDVRFKVLDAAKVRQLLANPANAPMLIAGDNPPLMPPHHALRGARYSEGQVFYILYPNPRRAVQPGAEVTVAMGDARIGPVTAQ